MLIGGIILQMVGWFPLIERVSYGRMALFGLPDEKERKLYPLGYYDAFQWVNSNLPPESLLLFIGETKSHRFQRKVIAPSVHNEHLLSELLQECNSSSELYEKLVKLGITHILINRKELSRLTGYKMFYWEEFQIYILRNFWETHLKEEYGNSILTVYSLSAEPSQTSAHLLEIDPWMEHLTNWQKGEK